MNTLDKLYLGAQIRAGIMKENFKKFMVEEHGVSNFVATIFLMLVVVMIIGIFWGRLQSWLEEIMDKIFVTEIGGSAE